jgi:hypothetical protein
MAHTRLACFLVYVVYLFNLVPSERTYAKEYLRNYKLIMPSYLPYMSFEVAKIYDTVDSIGVEIKTKCVTPIFDRYPGECYIYTFNAKASGFKRKRPLREEPPLKKCRILQL